MLEKHVAPTVERTARNVEKIAERTAKSAEPIGRRIAKSAVRPDKIIAKSAEKIVRSGEKSVERISKIMVAPKLNLLQRPNRLVDSSQEKRKVPLEIPLALFYLG